MPGPTHSSDSNAGKPANTTRPTDRSQNTSTALTPHKRFQTDTRSVFFTVEVILISVILVTTLIIAFAYIDPGASNISEDISEDQLQNDADDITRLTEHKGTLKNGVLYWDDDNGAWVDAGGAAQYTRFPSGHPLETDFNILRDRGINYNIQLQYLTPSGTTDQQTLIDQGTPGEEAVFSRVRVRLTDDDTLHGPDSGTTVSDADTFYAPDAFPDSNDYNIITVEIIIWR